MFTFIAVGASLDRVVVRPIGEADDEPQVPAAQLRERAVERFREFSVEQASCFHAHEKQHLLGVVEASFGSHAGFDAVVRRELLRALEDAHDLPPAEATGEDGFVGRSLRSVRVVIKS